jgi:hypothetical protein
LLALTASFIWTIMNIPLKQFSLCVAISLRFRQ